MAEALRGGEPLLVLNDIVKRYPAERDGLGRVTSWVNAVNGISLDVKPGETLGIVGESGCGKSTLGRVMIRLEDRSDGRILFDGRDVSDVGGRERARFWREVQMVFQDPYNSLNPRMRVFDIVSEPLVNLGLDRAELRRRTLDALRMVGLSEAHANRLPHAFSGGQRQRIGIARAFAAGPRLVVCDEAVSALDVSVQAQILELLRRIQQETGVALVFISHNLGVVRFLCHRIAVLYLGKVVELANEHDLFTRPQHPYTQALLASIPELGGARERRLAVLKGELPNPLNPPPGCAFHLRCPRAEAICKTTAPPLVEAGDGHQVACHFPGPPGRAGRTGIGPGIGSEEGVGPAAPNRIEAGETT